MSFAMALAAVALVGYLFGRVGRRQPDLEEQPGELRRATQVALQLEAIADDLRHDLARHRAKVEHFKRELAHASDDLHGELDDEAWRKLEELAEEMLGPTLQLGGQLSGAYDRIRRQTQSLAHFTGGRSDRQTGLGNGKALEEQLALLLEKRDAGFSLAMLSAAASDNSDEPAGEQLERVAALLRRTLRQTDFAARYGMDEIVVLMPETTQEGARIFGDRFRGQSQDELGIALCCGLAESQPDDTPKSVLARADSALYSARAAGPGRQYAHAGGGIAPADSTPPAPALV
ncbi:MAG: diguanylate cyclase [Planctomycetota bacterium]